MSQSVVKVVRPTEEHLQFIAQTMRESDRIEVMASSGLLPYDSLKYSCENSQYSSVLVIDDVPVVIFGLSVINVMTGLGSPWLLASEEMMKNKRQFLDIGPKVIEQMRDICPRLYNYVHHANKSSIRWLKWMGFTVDSEPVKYGVSKDLFHKFHLGV